MVRLDIEMPLGCIYEKNGKTEYCPLCNHYDVPFCQIIDDEVEIGIDERPYYCPLSAEPQIIVCGDGEFSTDLISRQKAIDALGEEPDDDDSDYALGCRNQWKYDVEAIKGLPSTRVQGRVGNE